jgi:hypothetical protein
VFILPEGGFSFMLKNEGGYTDELTKRSALNALGHPWRLAIDDTEHLKTWLLPQSGNFR